MTTRLLLPALEPDTFRPRVLEPDAPSAPATTPSDSTRFAEEQIRQLVRQVFSPGWPKPARHVVFSAVDETTYIAEVCMDVAKALADRVDGSVCVVEANPHNPELESVYARKGCAVVSGRDGFSLRSSCQHISNRLWLAQLRVLLGENESLSSVPLMERRLADLRLEFDYTVLHAPPAGRYSEAVVLGHLSDGVALVLEANATRRVAAQRIKEMLQAANARVLGVVLTERTFPIPDVIYRNL